MNPTPDRSKCAIAAWQECAKFEREGSPERTRSLVNRYSGGQQDRAEDHPSPLRAMESEQHWYVNKVSINSIT